ncbi:hypothetical protein Tco_0831978, partial [Tanacetum coccineum]
VSPATCRWGKPQNVAGENPDCCSGRGTNSDRLFSQSLEESFPGDMSPGKRIACSLSTLHFLKFPENSLKVLKLLENSVELLKILESKLESMKILENKWEPLKLQENQPIDGHLMYNDNISTHPLEI